MTGEAFSIVTAVMDVMATLFVILVGLGILTIIVLFVVDVTQTKSAIRRNYPVVGRFRYFFEHLGEFFRQYFFAMDREEMPFNRAQRIWAYRAAKNIDNTVGFGSTRDLRPTGTVMYTKNMLYEVGLIAHSCGVREPRELRRFHARIVSTNGLSIPLNELHPDMLPPLAKTTSV